MKIGIDIDEIVTEYMKSFLEFLETEKGICVDYNSITEYLNPCQSEGMKREHVKQFVQEHTEKEYTLLELDIVDGSLNAIDFLDKNHEICFITSRHISNKEKTHHFFKKHFPNNEFKIFFSGDCWEGSKTKAEICIEESCSILIEDNPDYAFDCAKKGIKVFLLGKPWNKDYEKHENIIKVQNWNEILKYLEKENGR